MSTLIKENGTTWIYTSNRNIKYHIIQCDTELIVIMDEFIDYKDSISYKEVLIDLNIVDYLYGDIEKDTDEIKKDIDIRVCFYEKHERTVHFCGKDDARHYCYLGSEEKDAWMYEEEISISDFGRYMPVKRLLAPSEAKRLMQQVWMKDIPEINDIVSAVYNYSVLHDTNIKLCSVNDYETYIRNYVNLYDSMDEIVLYRYDIGNKTMGDTAKQCYDAIGKSIFIVAHGKVIEIL